MSHYKKLIGEKCYLSPLSLDDADKIARWENDLEVAFPLGDEAYYVSAQEKTAERIREIINQQSHVFGIVDLESDELIGRSMLFGLEQVSRAAELGLIIGEKDRWDKGLGQEATRLTVEYGFYLLNLNSIMLGVFSFNERAIRCYNKVGFKEIGRRRQARIVGQEKFDLLLMDLLAEEYEPRYINRVLDTLMGAKKR